MRGQARPSGSMGKLSKQNKAVVGGVALLAGSCRGICLVHHQQPTPPPTVPPVQNGQNGQNGQPPAQNGQNGQNGQPPVQNGQNPPPPVQNGKQALGNGLREVSTRE